MNKLICISHAGTEEALEKESVESASKHGVHPSQCRIQHHLRPIS